MKKLLLIGITAASTLALPAKSFALGPTMYWAIQNNSPYIIKAVEAGRDEVSGFTSITANPGCKSQVVDEGKAQRSIQGIDLINVTLNQKIAHVEIATGDYPFGPGILPNTVSGVYNVRYGNTEVNPNSYVSISYTGINSNAKTSSDVAGMWDTYDGTLDTFGDIVIN